MEDIFKIYIDQLRGGKTLHIDSGLPPEIMEIEESDLSFRDEVKVKGEAYLADDALVMHLDLQTTAVMPCAVCNESISLKIAVKGAYHIVPMAEIKGRIYDIRDFVRESILLETPSFTECGGKCPKRAELKHYIKEEKGQDGTEPEGYRPFADLK